MHHKYYTADEFVREYNLILSGARILNAGSSTTRFGQNCINVDIQDKPNVDLIADLHELPDDIGKFDAVICNAVLQYCHSPKKVIEEFHRVLEPGGLLFIDAPWVQPYCDDTPDLFRFSERGLISLLDEFEVVSSGPSISPGSALAMQGSYIAGSLSRNKYIAYAFTKAAEVLLYPMRWIRTQAPYSGRKFCSRPQSSHRSTTLSTCRQNGRRHLARAKFALANSQLSRCSINASR